MSHFDVSRFYDKNSERFMFSKRIKQLMSAVRSDFFVIDSESTGDFFFRDGQYYFDDREKASGRLLRQIKTIGATPSAMRGLNRP